MAVAGVRGWGWRAVSIVVALFMIAVVGFSRIYLGVHYPTDVLAGWSAGTAWAIICSAILVWWEWVADRAQPCRTN